MSHTIHKNEITGLDIENYSYDLNSLLQILDFSIEKIFCSFSHINFKNILKTFDVSSSFEIVFEEKCFYFNRRLNQKVIKFPSKRYNENWKPNEMEGFVNEIIKDTMQEIQVKIKANQ